jgi:metallophosphoesterase (TIGR00282 family)
MRILFFGDINGSVGLKYLKNNLERIKSKHPHDFIVVNAENASTGARGISNDIYYQLKAIGVDLITLGNWCYGDLEYLTMKQPDIIKPLNVVGPGNNEYQVTIKGKSILFLNVLGSLYMHTPKDYNSVEYPILDPFSTTKAYLESRKYDYAFIDFHAETTGEKIALAYYLGSRVSAFVGTHTHVQTSDERLLSTGCLYISDVGMTGPIESVIGADINQAINNLTNTHKVPKKEGTGKAVMGYVVIDLELKTIKRYLEYEQ